MYFPLRLLVCICPTKSIWSTSRHLDLFTQFVTLWMTCACFPWRHGPHGEGPFVMECLGNTFTSWCASRCLSRLWCRWSAPLCHKLVWSSMMEKQAISKIISYNNRNIISHILQNNMTLLSPSLIMKVDDSKSTLLLESHSWLIL